MFSGSDHFCVLARLRLRTRWTFRPKHDTKVTRMKNEKLLESETKSEYERRLRTELEGKREGVDCRLEELWSVFVESLNKVAEDVCGRKTVGVRRSEKNAWWNEEIEQAVKEKKAAYRRTLQRNLCRRVRERRRREYREWNK